MRYVSVFSGVEAATLAWDQLGWEPVAFSEIDLFPSAVLAERFPDIPNLGDITQIDWSEIGPVGLVVCVTDERVGWTSEIEGPVAFAQNTRDEVRYVNGDGAISGALAANPGMKQTSYVKEGSVVRRLTPRECERLQGMPDDWTRIPYRGKSADDCPDGPRYKAIGNSMAVPVMRWIGERIAMVDKLERRLDGTENRRRGR